MTRLFLVFAFVVAPVLGDVLTAEGKKAALDNHNGHRRSLAAGSEKNKDGQAMPTATNMKVLKYSTELEEKAQDWAKGCNFAHTPNINYGQNLFMSSEALAQDAAMNQAGDSWWSELKEKFSGTNVDFTSATFSMGVGHFTQMAWAECETVGCAVQKCSFGTMVVCNYDKGNMLNDKIYESGTTCSKCQSDRECKNSLCAIKCKK